MAVDRKTRRIARFRVKDDAAEAEFIEVLPRPVQRERLFFQKFTRFQPGIQVGRKLGRRRNFLSGDLADFRIGPVGLKLLDQIVLLAQLRAGERRDFIDRIKIVDRALVELQFKKRVIVGMLIQKLLRRSAPRH